MIFNVKAKVFFAIILILATLLSAGLSYWYAESISAPGTNSVIEPGSMNISAKCVVYKDGSTYLAKDGQTGENKNSNADMVTEIEYCFNNLLTAGRTWLEKVLVKADGTVNSPLDIPSYTFLEVQGRWTAKNSLDLNMIQNSDQTNGNTDVTIYGGIYDGSKASQNPSSLTSNCIMFSSSGSPNRHIKIDSVNVRECNGEGVGFRNVVDSVIVNSIAFNMADDGFSVEDGSKNVIITNNVAHGNKTPQGIIEYGSGFECDDGAEQLLWENNIAFDNRRGLGCHVHAGQIAPKFISFIGNIVWNNSFVGLNYDPLSTGIRGEHLLFSGNIINGTGNYSPVGSPYAGIAAESCDFCVVSNNIIDRSGTSTQQVVPGIFFTDVKYSRIEGNTISNGQWRCMNLFNVIDLLIEDNICYNNTQNPSGPQIVLDGASSNDVSIIGNRIRNSAGTAGIRIVSSAGGQHLILNNDVRNSGSPFIDVSTTNAARIESNLGWNPKGLITNPFVGGSSIQVPGTGITGNAAPAASTDYTSGEMGVYVTSTGGVAVSITIKDPIGNTIESGLTTLTNKLIPYGYKINWGAFSGAPTVTVFGN